MWKVSYIYIHRSLKKNLEISELIVEIFINCILNMTYERKNSSTPLRSIEGSHILWLSSFLTSKRFSIEHAYLLYFLILMMSDWLKSFFSVFFIAMNCLLNPKNDYDQASRLFSKVGGAQNLAESWTTSRILMVTLTVITAQLSSHYKCGAKHSIYVIGREFSFF